MLNVEELATKLARNVTGKLDEIIRHLGQMQTLDYTRVVLRDGSQEMTGNLKFSDGTIRFAASQYTTGGGAAGFGVNSPAVTPGAVHTWIKMQLADGTVVYVPAWK